MPKSPTANNVDASTPARPGRNAIVSRRGFVCAAAAAAVRVGCPTPTNAGEAAKEKAGEYFDIHIHLTQPWYGTERGPVTATAALRWMDAHGIAQAAVLPLVSPESFWYPISTDFVLRETADHRDRLVPFCAIDPRSLATHLPTKQDVCDMLNRFRDAGCRGFGEHKPMMPVDDPLCMRLYEACAEVGLPVLFHLDNKANMDRPGLPGVANVLKSFPDLKFIGHGKGFWASIAGGLAQDDLQVGYPAGPVAPGGALDALMEAYPNLYGDLSSSGAHAILRDPKFGQQFLSRRADRLLFGTDYYDLLQRSFLQFEMFDRVELAPADRAKIAAGNARRMLGLA